MPFAKEYEKVWRIIKSACEALEITAIRADEIKEIGPIINQIFRNIENVDFVIAEISDKNPNVYYEIGISHCIGKPTVLLAKEDIVNKGLPFDIKHNRIFGYDINNAGRFKEKLIDILGLLRKARVSKGNIPGENVFLNSLSFIKKDDPQDSVRGVVNYIAEDFKLVNAVLVEKKMIQEGFLLTVEDAFKQRITALVDINGVIKNVKRVT